LKDLHVIYCNYDDDFNGANLKAEYVMGLENITMIDGQKTNIEVVFEMMEKSIEDGSAPSMCFVLDTLTRFVPEMDKAVQRVFNALVQKFISAQGTIIGLGHTNKHKNADGKLVHGGTSDIPNCFSQTSFLEIETNKDEPNRQVKFKNDKLRGIGSSSTRYRYKHGDKKNWLGRVATVEVVSETEADELVQEVTAQKQRGKDQPIIDYILSQLAGGPKSHTNLAKDNPDATTGSRRKRDEVLERYAGEVWEKSRGQNGGWNYYIEAVPPSEVQKKPWE
jgi:hypothetical protein